MQTIEEKIAKTKERVAILERQKRIEDKKKREAKKKKDQRRNYIVGELVTKYFPEISNFEPGTKAKNSVTLKPLEIFLSILADNQELMKQLKKEMDYRILNENEKDKSFPNKIPQCVSGHKQMTE